MSKEHTWHRTSLPKDYHEHQPFYVKHRNKSWVSVRTAKRSTEMRMTLAIAVVILLTAGTGICETQQLVKAGSLTSQNSTIDTGDTAWVLISAALVMLMTPGLAFFYGGLVRRKNMLSVLMQCFMALCIISIQWVVCGYSLSFGPDKHGIIGGLDWSFLNGVGMTPNAAYAPTIPHEVFMMFQMMFAIITPALILGAFAERMKFSAFVAYMLLWTTFVYDPVCHWVWGMGGWLRNLGALDFAGGTVVHINAGIAALVTAPFIFRKEKANLVDKNIPAPHNMPFVVLRNGFVMVRLVRL